MTARALVLLALLAGCQPVTVRLVVHDAKRLEIGGATLCPTCGQRVPDMEELDREEPTEPPGGRVYK